MGKNYRSGRIGEEIRKIISEMLLRELKDPRLLSGLVSITSVEVTNDHSYATVFVTVVSQKINTEDNEEQKKEVLGAFNSAKGFIRREIGKELELRHVPELIFKFDTSLEYGRHMDEIINSLSS
jgi:ribosome-binding factor A